MEFREEHEDTQRFEEHSHEKHEDTREFMDATVFAFFVPFCGHYRDDFALSLLGKIIIWGQVILFGQTSDSMNTENRRNEASFRDLLRRVHHDEKGALSIEMILIIAAIALPILIFVIKYGWPAIKDFFERGLRDLEGEASDAADTGLDGIP